MADAWDPPGWASLCFQQDVLHFGGRIFHFIKRAFLVVKSQVPTFFLFSSLPTILEHGFLTTLDHSVLVHCGLQIITPPFLGLVGYKEPSWSLISSTPKHSSRISMKSPSSIIAHHKMPFCCRWNRSRYASYGIIHLKMKSSIKTLQVCASLARDCQSHFSHRAHQR